MERKGIPDLLKGVAVILMIQVHIIELFANQDIFLSNIGKISLFLGGVPAAPVFMMVMGYFLVSSKKNFTAYLKRGVKLIIWGLLLNLGLNFHLLLRIFTGEFNLDPFTYIFGVDILFLAGISVIIIGALKCLVPARGYFYFFIAIVVSVFPTILGHNIDVEGTRAYFMAFISGPYHWSYFPILPWLAYPLAGYAFRLFEKEKIYHEIQKKYLWLVIMVAAAIIVVLFQYAVSVSVNLDQYYHHSSLFFCWALCFMIIYAIVFRHLEKTNLHSSFFKSIKWVGKNVTLFYVIQWIIIGNIATAIYKTQDLLHVVLWFVGITGMTILLVFLIRKIHFRKTTLIKT